ncbi:EAL domain-containing protein [Rhodoferax sp.]|uniref:bifunctional diguanylate cyclase/phosphodiesterase n=1 Tax=Rhodoferax sp. TaxID=50421 RepID=UPI00374D3D0B
MFVKVFQWRSLKTRVTLSTLAIFLVGIWSLAFYASRVLREDMRVMMGEHQITTTKALATELNNELKQRFLSLANLAVELAPNMPKTRETKPQLQSWINQRPITRNLFNAGFLIYRRDGTVVDADQRLADRLGSNGLGDEAVATAMREGASTVGRPVWDNQLRAWVLSMVIPLRGPSGEPVGALAGWTSLAEPNFLDRLTGKRHPRTGDYVLIEPKSRQVITASDKNLIAHSLPASGVDASVDRFVEGDGEYGLSLNRDGQELLSTSMRIGAAGWTLSSVLPAGEAFAPIYSMQKRMLLATLILSLVASGLTWWMLRRQFAPMLAAANTLADVAEKGHAVRPLEVPTQDEVGALIGGFNRLLEALAQREQAQYESEERFRTLVEWSPEAVVVHVGGKIRYVNPAAITLFGARGSQELVGTPIMDRMHPNSLARARKRAEYVEQSGLSVEMIALQCLRLDGAAIDVEVQGTSIIFDGAPAVHTVLRDISGRKRAESELRIAATAFESQQGMLVTDGQWTILRVNQAFTDITGYTAEEAVGKTPSDLLRSGLHDAAFFKGMLDSLESTGTWQGEVWDRRKNGEIFPGWFAITAIKDEQGRLTHYVDTFTDITSRKAAEEQIQKLAFFDPLTGLPNRRLLMDRLEQAMAARSRHARKGALLFVDLDNFKTLNDTHGHHRGDLLLQEVAQRLSTCIRKGDTVARLGGDEFVVMLEDLSEQALEAAIQAESVAEKILSVLNQDYLLAGYVHHSTPSIGITLFGEQSEGIEEPLKRADLAMYQAKGAGRNTLRFFDPQMQSVVTARAELEVGLRDALVCEQLQLYYQPQVVGESQLTGVEALVRWKHPVRGMVSPAEFIPLAEDTGLILPLGHWVLETACQQLASWAARPEMSHLTVAVNVSPRQFHQNDFVNQVLALLQRTGANPQRLKLELTESLLVANIEDVIAKMTALKGVGVGFSLDDFGTGYSSLSHLKLLPLDQLKIDQSFVRDILSDPNDAAIAKMVVALGDSLGLAVIAEGVETEAQREFLAGQGCYAYQGYLFSRPLPIEAFEALVQQLRAAEAA